MEFDESIYDKIDRFLNNDLSGEELEKFEAAIQSDEALAREVELNATMKDLLSDSAENNLRKNLQDLSDQFVEPPVKKAPVLKYALWLIVPILIALGWWLLTSDNSEKEPQYVDDQPKDPTEEVDPPKEKEDEIPLDPNRNDPTEKQDRIVKDEDQEDKKDSPKDNSQEQEPEQLFAENYTVNPSLEFLINNNTRSDNFKIEIENKVANTTLDSIGIVVPIQFSGKIESSENVLEKQLTFHLFSNNEDAYEDFQPLLSDTLSVTFLENNAYQFGYENYIPLEPGLYYYLFDEPATGKIYFVEKFEVRIQ